jgi:hypothetical protein
LEESNAAVTELREINKANARKVALLESQVKNSLTSDPEDKSGKAAEYVMQLEGAEKLLATSKEQLARAEQTYAQNLKKYKLANKKINEKEERGRQLGQEVKSSEMNARLAKLAQKFNVTDVGGLDNRLSEVEEEMQRKVARNNAVSEVQTDLGINGLAEAEEEERLAKANAKNKLEEYRKKMNLTSN